MVRSKLISNAESLHKTIKDAKRGLKGQALAAEATIDKNAMSWSSFQKNVADPGSIEAERARRGELNRNQGPIATTGMSYPPVAGNKWVRVPSVTPPPKHAPVIVPPVAAPKDPPMQQTQPLAQVPANPLEIKTETHDALIFQSQPPRLEMCHQLL